MRAPRRATLIAGRLGGPGYADGRGAAVRFSRPAGMAWLGDQLVVADQGNHCLRRVDPETGMTAHLAGEREPGFADGPAAEARFDEPTGVAVDTRGVVYVADRRNHAIRRLDPVTHEVTTIARSREQLGDPEDLALHGDDVLYVIDPGARRIRRIDLRTLVVTTVAGSAALERPAGLWCSGDALFVGDHEALRRIDLASGEVATVAGGFYGYGSLAGLCGEGRALYVGDGPDGVRRIELDDYQVTRVAAGLFASEDGSETAEKLRRPRGLAVRQGVMFVADGDAHCIRRIDLASEVVSSFAGRPSALGSTAEVRDGTGSRARFARIRGVTAARDERRLYVIDGNMQKREMRRVQLDDREVWRFAMYKWEGEPFAITATVPVGGLLYVAGDDHALRTFDRETWDMTLATGAPGAKGHMDGPLEIARFSSPIALCTAGDDVFVADDGTSLVRRIALVTERVSTLGGGLSFGRIGGIATDGQGTVFVADYGRQSIFAIDVEGGRVSTLAGDRDPGADDGIGAAARFREPKHLAFAAPYLYVADVGNRAIRRVHVETGEVVTVLGGGAEAIADPATGRLNVPGWIEALDDGSLVIVDTAEQVLFRVEL